MKDNIVQSAGFRARWNDACPSVMVTDTDLQFGLAQMRNLLDAEQIAFEFHAVRSMEEANSWIDDYLAGRD